MGGWSALAASRLLVPGFVAAGLSGCRCKSGNKLNIILHGLFVLNITDSYIQLLTPYVCEHIYKAGDWDAGYIKDLDQGDYELEGVVNRGKAPVLGNENIVLSQKGLGFQIDPSSRYCGIKMPLPETISFLRSMKGPNLYRGAGIHATGMALCTVLTYERCKQLKLANSKWVPRPDSNPMARFRNLHIWAEPQTRVSPLHTVRAYKQLMCFFQNKVDFTIATDDSPPLDHPEALTTIGLRPEEEMGWSEWETNGEGSRPTNCNTVIVGP
jgi:hypothetical protein